MEYSKMMDAALAEQCGNCFAGTGARCDETGCLVGFSQKCLDHYHNGEVRIAGGVSRIPVDDLKAYDKEDGARVIAIACKWCRNCEGNHSEDCVVALCRRSMEFATIGKELEYKGSSLLYLKELAENDSELSQMVMSEFSGLS